MLRSRSAVARSTSGPLKGITHSAMAIYGHDANSVQPFRLKEVTLHFSPAQLRQVAEFLAARAAEIEAGESWSGGRHLRDHRREWSDGDVIVVPAEPGRSVTEENPREAPWDQLVGEDLSGVVFVRDYLQLQFNPPPQVNVYSARVVVSVDGASAAFGEEPFANLLVGLIGRVVGGVDVVDGQSFRIRFSDGSRIEISLRPEDYRGPEVVDFQGRDNRWAVL
jgi:hypothetical protein